MPSPWVDGQPVHRRGGFW